MSPSFIIEIYEPGSTKTVWMEWRSNSPFMAISVGDILDTTQWPQEKVPVKAVRVSKVEHSFWGGAEEPTHRVRVYTETIT